MKQYFLLLLPFFSISLYAALEPEHFTFPIQQIRQENFMHGDKPQLRRTISCPDLNDLRRSTTKDQFSPTFNITYNGKNKVSQGNVTIDNSVQVKGIELKPELNVNVKIN